MVFHSTDSEGAPRCAARILTLAAIAAAAVLSGSPARAQSPVGQDEASIFRIQRIELSVFGGYLSGANYLDLPPLLDEQTNDTALDQILDFSGNAPDPKVEAPKKDVEAGWMVGGTASFYLTENFGMQLYGRYGKADAVFKGRQVIDSELQDETVEIDRTSITTFAGGGNIVYHLGRERKHPIRPFVNLGFGGILNQFPDTEDVGAIYFLYGGGIGFPVKGSIRGFVQFHQQLYTWETDEVSLDATIQFPQVSAGFTWRYEVPEDFEDPDAKRKAY